MDRSREARPPPIPKPTPQRPKVKDDRESQAEKIELERDWRDALRPTPGTLGGDVKP